MKSVAAFLLLSAPFLAGMQPPDPPPGAVHVRPRPFWTVGESLDFERIGLQYVRGDRITLMRGQEALEIGPFEGARRRVVSTCQDPGAPRPFLSQTKFRHGRWYSRNAGVVKRYDPRQQRWIPVLSPKGLSFTDFEISPLGDCLLIGSAEAQRPGLGNHGAWPLSHSVEGTESFLDIYPPGAETPTRRLPLPEGYRRVFEEVQNLLAPSTSFWMGDQLILFLQQTAQMWVFDGAEERLHELEVPWTCLDARLLERLKHRKPAPETKRNALLSVHAIPKHVQFYPTDEGTLRVLILHPRRSPETLRAWQTETREAAQIFPAGAPWVVPEHTPGSELELYELNVAQRTFKALALPESTAQACLSAHNQHLHWIDPQLQLWKLRPDAGMASPTQAPPKPPPAPKGPHPDLTPRSRTAGDG